MMDVQAYLTSVIARFHEHREREEAAEAEAARVRADVAAKNLAYLAGLKMDAGDAGHD